MKIIDMKEELEKLIEEGFGDLEIVSSRGFEKDTKIICEKYGYGNNYCFNITRKHNVIWENMIWSDECKAEYLSLKEGVK